MCEVPSCIAQDTHISHTSTDTPFQFAVLRDRNTVRNDRSIEAILSSAASCVEDAYRLCRLKASEVLVWILSDVNRMWKAEIPHAIPVAYAMKGYSLDNDVMRNMCETVMQALHDKEISVVCSTFDGQWNKLASRDQEGRPLTLIQLQRDVATIATKRSKPELISFIANFEQFPDCVEIHKTGEGKIDVSTPMFMKVSVAQRRVLAISTKRKKNQNQAIDLNRLPETALFDNDIMTELRTDGQSEGYGKGGNSTTYDLPDNQPDEDIEQIHNCDTGITSNALFALQNHKEEKIASKWKNKDIADIRTQLSCATGLNKFNVKELDAIYHSLSIETNLTDGWSSLLKASKVNLLSRLVGDGSSIDSHYKSVPSLKTACVQSLRRRSRFNEKDVLNAAYSTLIFKKEQQTWASRSPYAEGHVIKGLDEYVQWFSYPAFHETRNRLEPKCLDREHLLVNARVKVCKDGMMGLNKQAWHDVAKHDSNIISPCVAINLIDRQCAENAKRTFSSEVEACMRSLGYQREAHFCELIRNWYLAEDAPGISAMKRTQDRFKYRKYLLDGVDFGQFPAYGGFIKGMPKVMFEGFLQSIDCHIQLYPLCINGTYNQRSVSSLVNETFFGELQELEPTRLGCPKAVNVPRMMSSVTEMMHHRHNPRNR